MGIPLSSTQIIFQDLLFKWRPASPISYGLAFKHSLLFSVLFCFLLCVANTSFFTNAGKEVNVPN